MKEIVITNPNGITLHTKKSLVNDDIKIKLDKSIKAVDGVQIVDGGPYGAKDLIIDGSKDFSGIIVDGYNGNLLINNSANREQRTNVNIAGFVEVNLNDEHEYNLITSKNLEPQNIKKGVNILGVTGTFEGGSSEDTLTALINNTLISYSNDTSKDIKDYLFNNNSNLESVYLPNAKKIGDRTFYRCSKLKKAIVSSATELGQYCFDSCSVLEEVDVSSVTTARQTSIFGYCYALKVLKLPKLTLVFNLLCPGCSSLYAIYLNSANTINGQAFQSATALTDIYLGYEGLVSLSNTNAFSGVPSGCKIHVRSEYAEQYATATNWSSAIADGQIVIVGDYSD